MLARSPTSPNVGNTRAAKSTGIIATMSTSRTRGSHRDGLHSESPTLSLRRPTSLPSEPAPVDRSPPTGQGANAHRARQMIDRPQIRIGHDAAKLTTTA